MSYAKVMMKRWGIFLTTIFVTGLLAGCGKLEDQEPAAKDTGKPATSASNDVGPLSLTDGKTVPVDASTNLNAHQTIVSADGALYEGEMKNGRPNGQGTLTDPRGSYQKGEWRDGAAYRVSGTCVLPDGTREEGTTATDVFL